MKKLEVTDDLGPLCLPGMVFSEPSEEIIRDADISPSGYSFQHA